MLLDTFFAKKRPRAERATAKVRGVRRGPKPVLTLEQVSNARQSIAEEQRQMTEAARLLGVHKAPLYRALSK